MIMRGRKFAWGRRFCRSSAGSDRSWLVCGGHVSRIGSILRRPGWRGGTAARRVEVPSACVSWPKDVGFTPRKWNEAQYNLKRVTIMPPGGHFGAFEEPQLYLKDVRAFFKDLR